jgi:NTE family protein
VLGTVMDVYRLRQCFDAIVRTREVIAGMRDDAGFLRAARRALVPLPFDRRAALPAPFPERRVRARPSLNGKRIGLVATGGSGAMASVVGVGRALEELGVTPAVISLCSGSALFGFPLAAGLGADKTAEVMLALDPGDYLDVAWRQVAAIVPRAGRGFGGIVHGDRVETACRRWLGDMRLGELPIPAYAPIWNIEANRVEYLGPRTHPDLPVARAIRMAIAMPLFFEPVELDGVHWCDGGIVDIFPVRPVVDIEPIPDLVVAVNGFYPPGFAGDDATGWRDRRWSILYAASQVRTCQHIELARHNLDRLRRETDVVMVDPVPHDKVRGIGFYRQFLDNSEWPAFMQAGRDATLAALSARQLGSGPSALPRRVSLGHLRP